MFVQAAVQTGLPFNEDFNGASQEGAGDFQRNIRRGKRQSSARTFLEACKHRPNLTVVTGALTEKILFEDNRAVGVQYQQQQKKGPALTEQVYAKGEVILCGGTINSPQLLELSGIGSRQLLEDNGIEVIADVPGVGENLQDHLTINVQQGIDGLTTFYEETRPLAMLGNLFKYFTTGKGLLAHPAAQVGVFFLSLIHI